MANTQPIVYRKKKVIQLTYTIEYLCTGLPFARVHIRIYDTVSKMPATRAIVGFGMAGSRVCHQMRSPMSGQLKLYIYDAPTGEKACAIVKSRYAAAQLFLANPKTIQRRSQVLDLDDPLIPRDIASALSTYSTQPGQALHLSQTGWVPADKAELEHLLVSVSQTQAKHQSIDPQADRNRLRALRCDDETWQKFLALGSTRWLIPQVSRAYARKFGKAKPGSVSDADQDDE